MQVGKVGNRVQVESERVGEPQREGAIVKVLGSGDSIHYSIRWDDGHESILYPTAGTMTIIPKRAVSRR